MYNASIMQLHKKLFHLEFSMVLCAVKVTRAGGPNIIKCQSVGRGFHKKRRLIPVNNPLQVLGLFLTKYILKKDTLKRENRSCIGKAFYQTQHTT